MHARLSNTWHAATGKGHHITCIKDTSLLRTIYCGPAVSVIQMFHCIQLPVVCASEQFQEVNFLPLIR